MRGCVASWLQESFEEIAGSRRIVGRKFFEDVAMIRLIVVLVLTWLAPTVAEAQSLKEIRIVFPIPLFSKMPRPAALLIVPENKVPDSVMPKWSG